MNDPSVEISKKTRNKNEKKLSGGMLETRSRKVSEDKRIKLRVEIHRSPAQYENLAGHGTQGDGIRRLMSEPTPLEQGLGFATSNAIL